VLRDLRGGGTVAVDDEEDVVGSLGWRRQREERESRDEPGDSNRHRATLGIETRLGRVYRNSRNRFKTWQMGAHVLQHVLVRRFDADHVGDGQHIQQSGQCLEYAGRQSIFIVLGQSRGDLDTHAHHLSNLRSDWRITNVTSDGQYVSAHADYGQP